MGYISPLAVIGSCPEHRGHIWKHYDSDLGVTQTDATHAFLAPEIDPSAIVDALCTVDCGIEQPTRIGYRSWLQKRVHVGHDAQIGSGCEIAVGVTIGGHVTIGNNVRIGGNTWIKPRIVIGDGAVIGGGAVVVKDVPAGEVWVGNPAKRLRPAEQTDEEMFLEQFMRGRVSEHDTHDHRFYGP